MFEEKAADRKSTDLADRDDKVGSNPDAKQLETHREVVDAARKVRRIAIHNSFWCERNALTRTYPKLEKDHQTDVLVIGAGITGLSTALELLQRGFQVTVCDAAIIGAGTTGGSSGHLDAHPEVGPKKLIGLLGEDKASAYTRGRLNAIESIEKRVNGDCHFVRVPGYYYTESADNLDQVRENYEHAIKLGLPVTWSDSVPISDALGGYAIDGMARIDCLAYVKHLATLVEQAGGIIFEETIVDAPIDEHPTSLKTGDGPQIEFEQVVCAVHCNFTDSMLLYLQTPPTQSYVIAANVTSPLTDALFWDDSDPYYYTRRGSEDGKTILVGGCDHHTGAGDERDSLYRLEDWIRKRFVVEEIVSRWSAEFFEPTDGIPFIGKAPGKNNVWIATGLSGVGLTLGTLAGTMFAELLQGKDHELSEVLKPDRVSLSSTGKMMMEQGPAVADFAERILPASEVDVENLQPGQGAVGKVDGQHVAVCRDYDGCLHRQSPICTHMGGVVRWNEFEQTWDCPVHGGRFAANGDRLYGPPGEKLKELDQGNDA